MKKQIVLISILMLGCFALTSMSVLTTSPEGDWEVPSKYEKLKNPYAGQDDADNIGRMLYSKHCKSCHGSKGKGDGPKADSIDTEMGDFTDGSLTDQKDGALYYKTYIGRDDMPSFEKKIKDEKQQWLLINYLRKLGQ